MFFVPYPFFSSRSSGDGQILDTTPSKTTPDSPPSFHMTARYDQAPFDWDAADLAELRSIASCSDSDVEDFLVEVLDPLNFRTIAGSSRIFSASNEKYLLPIGQYALSCAPCSRSCASFRDLVDEEEFRRLYVLLFDITVFMAQCSAVTSSIFSSVSASRISSRALSAPRSPTERTRLLLMSVRIHYFDDPRFLTCV